jgi:hypothetical protein
LFESFFKKQNPIPCYFVVAAQLPKVRCRPPISSPQLAYALSLPAQQRVSAIKPYEGFGDVDHTIKDLMSL